LRERERSLSHGDVHVSPSHKPEYHPVHPCGAAYTISQKQENGQISKVGLSLVGFESSGPGERERREIEEREKARKKERERE